MARRTANVCGSVAASLSWPRHPSSHQCAPCIGDRATLTTRPLPPSPSKTQGRTQACGRVSGILHAHPAPWAGCRTFPWIGERRRRLHQRAVNVQRCCLLTMRIDQRVPRVGGARDRGRIKDRVLRGRSVVVDSRTHNPPVPASHRQHRRRDACSGPRNRFPSRHRKCVRYRR